MFKKTLIIALVTVMALASLPLLAPAAGAAPADALGESFGDVDPAAPSDLARAKLVKDCQNIADQIEFNESWTKITWVGTTLGLQYTTAALKKQWVGNGCHTAGIRNAPAIP